MTNIISITTRVTKLPKILPDIGDIIDGVHIEIISRISGGVNVFALNLDETTLTGLIENLTIAKQQLGAVAIEGDKIRVTTTEKYDWGKGEWKEVES